MRQKVPLYFGLGWFGIALCVSLPAGLLWGEVGVDKAMCSFRALPRGSRAVLCCLMPPAALTSLLCPGLGWETFVLAMAVVWPGFSVTHLVFYLLSYFPISIPNILKCQHHLKASKESLEEGIRTLCHRAYDRKAICMAGSGSPCCGWGLFPVCVATCSPPCPQRTAAL